MLDVGNSHLKLDFCWMETAMMTTGYSVKNISSIRHRKMFQRWQGGDYYCCLSRRIKASADGYIPKVTIRRLLMYNNTMLIGIFGTQCRNIRL